MKLSAMLDGKSVEVEVPDGAFIPQAEVTQKYVAKPVHDHEMAQLRTQLKDVKKPEQLLEDEEFRATAIEKWGLKPGKGGRTSSEDLEAARKDWDAKVLKPVAEENAALKTKSQRLLRRQLEAELIAAAGAAGVKPQFLKPPTKGARAPIVSLLEGAFGFDEQTDSWYAKDGDRFAVAAKPVDGAIYKGPAEFVAEWAGDKANADFVVDQRQRGAGFGGTGGGGGSGRPHVLSREDARDPMKYRAAKAAAEKAGVPLELEPFPGTSG